MTPKIPASWYKHPIKSLHLSVGGTYEYDGCHGCDHIVLHVKGEGMLQI